MPVAGVALFTTAAGSLTLESGASTTYSIGGGGGGALATIYSATSTKPAIISASVSGDKLTLKANGPGSANITIRDSSGRAIRLHRRHCADNAILLKRPARNDHRSRQ